MILKKIDIYLQKNIFFSFSPGPTRQVSFSPLVLAATYEIITQRQALNIISWSMALATTGQLSLVNSPISNNLHIRCILDVLASYPVGSLLASLQLAFLSPLSSLSFRYFILPLARQDALLTDGKNIYSQCTGHPASSLHLLP